MQGLSNLEIFEAKNNQLTELDLSNQSKIKSIMLTNNQLTSLEVKGSEKLSSLYVEKNRLTGIDVADLVALTGLYASNNPFTEFPDHITELLNLRGLFLQGTNIDFTVEPNKSVHQALIQNLGPYNYKY